MQLQTPRSIALLRFALGAVLAAASAALAACEDDSPCDPGQVYRNSACYPAPTATGGSTGNPGDGAAGETSGETSQFGKSCTSQDECGGDAPICGAPQLPMCTQINCAEGEANAGACPPDWMCISPGGSTPSACVKL